jgi:hypothetical protein
MRGIECLAVDCLFADVQSQVFLAVPRVGAMAEEALVGKDGQDLAGVGNFLRSR